VADAVRVSELTSRDKVLIIHAWVVHIMYHTCKYGSKYLQIGEHVLHIHKQTFHFTGHFPGKSFYSKRSLTKPISLSQKPTYRQPVSKPYATSPFIIIIIIITQPKSWYSFYHPIEGRRLSSTTVAGHTVKQFTCPQMVIHHANYYYLSAWKQYSFYCPTEGRRLSRPWWRNGLDGQ